MEIYITNSIAGFIAFDDNLDIINYNLFKDEDIALKLFKLFNNEVLDEEIELIESLIKNNGEDYSFNLITVETNNRLSNYINILNDSEYAIDDLNIQIQTPNKGGEYFRSNLKEILIELGFSTPGEYKSKLISIYNELAILKMKEASQDENKLIIQAINSIDEIDESISKLIERIREWNILYFPEIDVIQNNESFINLIANYENRDEIIKNPPESIETNQYIDIENGSFGADIEDEDIEMINDFAKSIQSFQSTRKKTEEYIDKKMEKLAPNLRDLLGSTLGAKLIAHIGGLKDLAMYSAATIQIMGAEKALFRHLKTGERPPKHGLIFQHPQVRTSPWWVRGKIARTLALKISLAVRKDVFSGKFDPTISENFLKRVEEIKKENPFPKKTTKRRQEERSAEKGKNSNYSRKSGKYKKKKSKKKNKKRK
ncbi:ATP-binding protein [Methanobrevibacter sp. TMH8]|uniref:NOP5/NOP56 family protein n=1 Tax=Methanobrevibacter sp. TMH8 TaxID=2848611 RepID=UPI001CCE3F99|nr:ATP-binding protein [Methanobrevibacter sp. TMH8]MBZ9571436.1 ATP-binding protein [Methanobrevibacter sp. TMH8]